MRLRGDVWLLSGFEPRRRGLFEGLFPGNGRSLTGTVAERPRSLPQARGNMPTVVFECMRPCR